LPRSLDFLATSTFNGCASELALILPNTKLESEIELLILDMPPSSNSTLTSISTNDYKLGPFSMKGFSTTIVEHSITYIIYYLVGSIS
jgi:hypothetical protein